MKRTLHFFLLFIFVGVTSMKIFGQSCEFAPFPPQGSVFNNVCTAALTLECPEMIAPDCGCIPDPSSPPNMITGKFDLQFKAFPPGGTHLDTTVILFKDVPLAGCADVEIHMTAIGDLSSIPFEYLVLVDENDKVICKVGGADCELVESFCTMSFCEFNLQASGGIRWKILPNSLITNGSSFPFCSENWVNVELKIPTSNIKAINDLNVGCGENLSLPFGEYKINWTSINKYTCEEIHATQEISIRDITPPVIMGCPAKGVVINLGPGECEASWDAPPFMAMDDCPGTSFFGAEQTSPGCQLAVNIVWNPGFYGGMQWDVQNVGTSALVIHGFDCQWRNQDTAALFYKTAPGTHVPDRFNPAAWTLCAGRTFVSNANGTAFPAPARQYIDLRTQTITTSAVCGGAIRRDTIRVGCPIIQPGNIQGLYFHGRRGQGGMYWRNGGCSTSGIPFGDATLKILNVTPWASMVFGTSYFGAGGGLAIGGNNQFIGNIRYSLPNNIIQVVQTCGQPYGPGCYFPVGCQTLCYEATDAAGNTSTCQFQVCVNAFPNPVNFLACHDEVQISLDENCFATISADEMLSGGPYKCFNDYKVEIRDWITNILIDRQPNVPGVQVGIQDIGKELKVTVRDSVTGNSCWGHVVVEDKLAPQLTCARDTCITCGTSETTPFYTGTPIVRENCGSYSLNYKDFIDYGSCALNYDHKIRRVWTAVDASGNKSECTQNITVALATLASVAVPHNFDDLDFPALSCDEKINKVKDYTPHYLAFPYCVDGYLLDSAHWFATGGFLPSPAGDLAGERLPRVLGWNCLDTGKFVGHPSPWPIYYPAHPSWRPNNPVCWGPDEIIMWQGTGYPTGYQCFNLGINFEDIIIDVAKPGCDAGPIGCYKVLRSWTVIDWCTSQIGGVNQIIKVIDREGPQVLYPDTVVINMEPFTCFGRWEVPAPWLIDNCSNEVHYTVEVENGTVLGNETSGFIVVGIEPGVWNGYIVAEDCCGNITQKRVAINSLDNVPPTAVCDQKTVVSITGNQSPGENYAKIFANDLDQGSFDNCAPHVFFKVIRMEQLRGTNNGSNTSQPDNGTNCAGVNGDDNAILDGNQIYFDDYINFCCSDVGKSIMVVLRVFDREPGKGPISPSRMNPGGNLFNRYSDCMVEVEVQDKTVPTVVAPPNIVVSCWFWFDVDAIDDPNDATFGRVVNNLSLRKKVVTNDLVCHEYCVRNDITGYPGYVPGAPPSNPPAWNRACDYYRVLFDTAHEDRKYELVWGFDGTVLGACGTNYSISVNDNRECGQGQLTRTIVARGPNGISVTATQTIWVVDCDPFYINRTDNCDSNDDITWPGNCTGQATTIDGCGADISPDNPLLGRPIIENHADDLCALISIEYYDEIFTIEPDACFKVLRRWVVIDWCQYDPNIDPIRGRWEYLQIIKVHDNDKPVITISFGDCEPAVKNPVDNICYGHITITADATDNCSPLDWLFYDYKIDIYNDGKGIHSGYDYAVGPLTRKEFTLGRTPTKHHNPLAEDENNPFDASGTYPIGIHKICWFVEDGCGNIAANCQLFEIKDCKAPTPYCHLGVVTTVMPSSGCITIWARDLDAGSYDNCTEPKNLKMYFKDFRSDSMTICCDDFVSNQINDELILPVTICVEDEEGNVDCCKTTVIVQDPQNVCPDVGSFGKITGELKTATDEGTQDADVQLLQSSIMKKQMVTSSNGQYLFGDLNYGASVEYVVKPSRTDDPLNGVSTADIVKIQRHILGVEDLNDPYKLIAADVNASKNITASDVSEIRKLILGVITKFNKMDSWTFVPKNFTIEPKDPWNAPRQALVQMPVAGQIVEDFVAIKVGDVTNNARAHNVSGSTIRSNGTLHLLVDDQELVAGQQIRISFKSSDFDDITGFQFTLKYDKQIMNFEKVESGVLTIDESNIGTNHLQNGILTTSWDSKDAISANKDAVLFTVVFKSIGNGKIGNSIAITSDVTSAEAYDARLNAKEIALGVRTEKGVVESGVFELYQNNPNPFSNETNITFRLPESGPVKLSIYEVTGKVVRVYEVQGTKGLNSIKIQRSELNTTGVLYYQLDAANHSETRRMIIMD